MKTVIIAMNSKYIHTPLAAWYLKASCNEDCGNVLIHETTINDSFNSVLSGIYCLKPDIAAFSCYIWNIEFVLKLVRSLKKILPETVIVLGGPEVSYDSTDILLKNEEIDFILAGEGETSFRKLIECLSDGRADITGIDGLFSRNGTPAAKPFAVEEDLSRVKSPYTREMLNTAGSRIVYYESSRGCPFSCSYCLSSTTRGVRYFPMERVKSELLFLVHSGVKQIKFVDRTFNCSRERAKEIFRFIIGLSQESRSKNGNCSSQSDLPETGGLPNFHFEAAADLFDDEMLEILAGAPWGLIQFEIGIQTVNEQSLEAVGRKTDTGRVFNNIEKLRRSSNCHIHLDLIAGLPHEDLLSFENSFNRVYRLEPNMLQLGFLKLLKGTVIRGQAGEFGYKYNEHPPYEVLESKFINYSELLFLKEIEEVLDRYFNSGKFSYTMQYLSGSSNETPFSLYKRFSEFLKDRGFFDRSFVFREYYTLLYEFAIDHMDGLDGRAATELLKLDFFSSNQSATLPEGIRMHTGPGFRESCFDFLRNADNIAVYLPQYLGQAPKEIWKHIDFEIFELDLEKFIDRGEIAYLKGVYLFDYSVKNPVNGQFRFVRVEF